MNGKLPVSISRLVFPLDMGSLIICLLERGSLDCYGLQKQTSRWYEGYSKMTLMVPRQFGLNCWPAMLPQFNLAGLTRRLDHSDASVGGSRDIRQIPGHAFFPGIRELHVKLASTSLSWAGGAAIPQRLFLLCRC